MYAFAPEKPPSLVGRNFCLAILRVFAKASNLMLSQKSILIDGQAKNAKCKARDCRAMRRTYVRRSSERIAATQQLVSFCDAIKE
jgi:hypothetical protein